MADGDGSLNSLTSINPQAVNPKHTVRDSSEAVTMCFDLEFNDAPEYVVITGFRVARL